MRAEQKVAIIHDWLTGMRGGERVLEAVCSVFPGADIFTLVHVPGAVSPAIERHSVTTSFIQRLPNVSAWYRHYLPLFPHAIEQFDLSGYTTVISLSHCVALGALTRPDCCHICYCFTPMRYVWDQYWEYFGHSSRRVRNMVIGYCAGRLRRWDVLAAQRPDFFMTTSRHVARRIAKYYRRECRILPPGVDLDAFDRATADDGFFLIVSALSPYKRLDTAVTAFRKMGKPLVIIGWGPEEARLRRLAGDGITIMGRQPDDVVRDHYARCRALVFPGEEDFGLTPIEAMASGKPVIGLSRGGLLETVRDGSTGVLYDQPGVDSLINAVERFETMRFDPAVIRRQVRTFGLESFTARFKNAVDEMRALHQARWDEPGDDHAQV